MYGATYAHEKKSLSVQRRYRISSSRAIISSPAAVDSGTKQGIAACGIFAAIIETLLGMREVDEDVTANCGENEAG